MSHEVVEKNVGLMALLILLVISVGGLGEIVPLFFLKTTTRSSGDRSAPGPTWPAWAAATATTGTGCT